MNFHKREDKQNIYFFEIFSLFFPMEFIVKDNTLYVVLVSIQFSHIPGERTGYSYARIVEEMLLLACALSVVYSQAAG
jgi:hypothetical protein